MSQTTYQLIKDEKIVMETQSISAEHTLKYFALFKPKVFTSRKYRVGIKPPMTTPVVNKLNQMS
jgi:isocitrate dehydrogenase